MTDLKPTAPARNLIRKLPVFSPVAVKLMGLLANDEVPFNKVAKLFALDPVLAGQILKLANSGLYGRQIAVQSVLQALAMLGLKNISRIAITAALTSGFPRPIPLWLRDWWRHSVAAALIADRAGIGTLNLDYGYTAGLLHSVGLLALLRNAPEEYSKLTGLGFTGASALQWEREQFGTDRAELAGLIAAEWGLPASLQRSIAAQDGNAAREPLAAAVQSGCYYAELLGFGQCGCCLHAPANEPAAPLDLALLKDLATEVNRLEIDYSLA